MNPIEGYLIFLYITFRILFADFALYHCASYLSYGSIRIHVGNTIIFSTYAYLQYVSVPSLL